MMTINFQITLIGPSTFNLILVAEDGSQGVNLNFPIDQLMFIKRHIEEAIDEWLESEGML